MKKISLIFILITVMLAALILAACNSNNPTTSTASTTDASATTTTAPVTTAAAEKTSYALSEYSIVRNMKASSEQINAAKSLRNLISACTDLSLKVTTDEVRKGQTLDNSLTEILLGNTNRDASITALEKLNLDDSSDYIIEIKGNKIVVNGKSDEALYYAIKEFIRLFVDPLDENAIINTAEEVTVMGSLNKKLEVLNNGKAVQTLATSVVIPSTGSVLWPTYGRVLQLQHSGENNGTLFVTGQWGREDFPVYRSTNDGKSWKLVATVSEQLKPTSEYVANWQPHIFELPNQLGDMPAGTLLLSGCTRDKNTSKETLMCIWRSYDLGETWEEYTVVDKGNGINDGMYEPFLICDEDGSLVCFYSDETEVSDVGGQRLVFRVSKDGVTWGEKQYCCAPAERSLRPGMVTVSKMGDHGYILCYEMIGELGGPIYVKRSDSLTSWDYEAKGTQVTDADKNFTGCTPYCTWTPDGGEYGTVIAAGRFSRPDWYTSDGDNKQGDGSRLFVSFDLGNTWQSIENPLPYDYNKDESANYTYSLGFFTGSDGSVYYVNNVFPNFKAHKYVYADLKVAKLKILDVYDEVK